MLGDYLRNGRFLALSIALLIVAGLAALATLPRTEDPRVLNRLGIVLTAYPGATPERVEALVSDPIENELRRLPEIKDISSTSRAGLSMVRIELADEITDTTAAWSKARDFLADVQPKLPAGALASEFHDDRGYAFTIQVALTWAGPGEIDLGVLNRYGRELESRLRAVPGTDLVRLYGERREEIGVRIDPGRLSALGVSAEAVAQAIERSDAKVAAGELTNDLNSLQVEVTGELDSLERVREIPIWVAPSGETVRVGDVATVERTIEDPPAEVAIVDGREGIVVAARMLNDLRIDRWRARIDQALARFEEATSANVEVTVIFDQSGYTNQRLGELAGNVAIGFVLIVAVLLVTLGLRAALVVALALPLTALFTLTVMNYVGLPIHQMSVTGLVVALGIMVDNAIVMVDSIQRRRRAGQRALASMLESIRHLWLPLLGSTLTTILAFAPIALMPGPAGEFVSGIALSVMFSLVGSYLISHTIIAGLAGRVLTHCPTGDCGGMVWQGIQVERLGQWFAGCLRWALTHPRATLAVVLVLPLAGFWAAGRMTEQFFPPADRDMFGVEVRLAPQSSIDNTARVTREIIDRLADEPGLISQHWFIGSGAPSFYYNMMANRDGEPQFAHGVVKVRDFHVTNRLIPVLQREFDDTWPEAQILVRKLEQGPPFAAPIEVRLFGPSLDRLTALGQQVRQVMLETPQVVHARATLEGARPKVEVVTREEVTRQSGLERAELARQLAAGLSGAARGSVLEGTEELPVRVRVDNARRGEMVDLGGLYIAPQTVAADGEFAGLPVSALATLELKPSRGAIPRRNGQRVNAIEGFLRADVLPAAVLADFQQRLSASDFRLPAGYWLEFAGESSERDAAVGNLMANVGVIAVLLVLVVVLSFNSFRLSGVIFAVAAQSIGLGLLAVWAFGYPFGFTVIVGLMGLMGLAINGAIVILAELKSDPRACRGDLDAIVEGVMKSSRHITSTTITTVGGFMPLILGGGGFWPPFAIAIAGGTVLTTTLSLVFAPVAFLAFSRRRAFEASEGPRENPLVTLRGQPRPKPSTALRRSA